MSEIQLLLCSARSVLSVLRPLRSLQVTRAVFFKCYVLLLLLLLLRMDGWVEEKRHLPFRKGVHAHELLDPTSILPVTSF